MVIVSVVARNRICSTVNVATFVVAQAVLFLLKNDFTTGTVVDVDGGATLP
jgi:hypothetical protein